MSVLAQLPRWAVDPLIRHKARLHELDLERYRVRVARHADEYEAAFRLVSSAYVAQGYLPPSWAGKPWITEYHPLAESVVLVAYDAQEQLVGTMTLTLDSPAGLPIESYYPEVDGLRRPGRRLVEYNALAVVGRCKGTGVSQLMNMAAYQVAYRLLGATDCVIEVHPRAQPIYRALFDFTPLGPPRPRRDLEIEVLGMHHDMQAVQSFVRRHYRQAMSTGLLPVEHFLEEPPPCIELPPVKNFAELTAWRISAEIFRQLYVERSARLASLDSRPLAHLQQSSYGRAMLASTKTREYPLPRLTPPRRAPRPRPPARSVDVGWLTPTAGLQALPSGGRL